MGCIDPSLRVAVAEKTPEELDLENLRGKFTETSSVARQGSTPTDAGDGAALAETSTTKEVGRQRRRARGLAAATQ